MGHTDYDSEYVRDENPEEQEGSMEALREEINDLKGQVALLNSKLQGAVNMAESYRAMWKQVASMIIADDMHQKHLRDIK